MHPLIKADVVLSRDRVVLFPGFLDLRAPLNLICEELGMSRKALVLDGLWYCLCPSFTSRPLNCARTPFLRGKRSSYFPGILAGSISASPRRCLSNNSAKAFHGSRSVHEGSLRESREYVSPEEDQEHRPSNADENPEHNAGTLPGTESSSTSPQRKRPPGVPKTLADRPTSYLENRLQDITATNPNIVSTTQILRILIRDRHVRPDARHYRALILANSDAERGSPEVVRQLLADMEENGVPADSATLHAAVQVCPNFRNPSGAKSPPALTHSPSAY